MNEYRSRYTAKTGTTVRFSLRGIGSEDEAASLLEYIYNDIVAGRGRPYDGGNRGAIRRAAAWLYSGGRCGLAINGPVGSGKTTLLKAIYRLLTTTEGASRKMYTTANCIVACAGQSEESKALNSASLLFIDDLGTESLEANTYGNRTLPIAEVIYDRYERMLPTLFTTNLTRDKFAERYGERVADRAREMFDWISFRNGSYR